MIKSADEFVRLRTSRVPAEYHRAAHDPADFEVWREIVEDYPEMREWVACNKAVPVEILDILASDADSKVRMTVAIKRKLPEYLQLQLSTDPDIGVREQVVRNAKVSPRVLHILVEDREPRIREFARTRLLELS